MGIKIERIATVLIVKSQNKQLELVEKVHEEPNNPLTFACFPVVSLCAFPSSHSQKRILRVLVIQCHL